MSYRIQTNFIDKSGTVKEIIGSVGSTVIRATKGPIKPTLFFPGEEKRITEIFGIPTSSNPDIWDAIQFNNSYPCWIAAPSKNGKQGGVLITKNGTEALTSGLTSSEIAAINFSLLPVEESLGAGDGSTTNFTITLTDKDYYVNQSIDIEVDGTSIAISATDTAIETLTSTAGSGTYNRSTGVIDFTFNVAPTSAAVITTTYNADRSADTYFALFNNNAEDDDMAVQVTYSSGVFTITIYYIDNDGNYVQQDDSPYAVSLTAGTKDGFGKNIYIGDIFDEDNDSTTYAINSSLAITTFVDDTTYTDMAGGDRGDTISSTELNLSYAYFQDGNKYPADIFFDCTADSDIASTYNTMRNSYQKYSYYLIHIGNVTAANAISTKQALSLDNEGLAIYWSWFKISNPYENSYFYGAAMGRIASKHAQMYDVYNGLAPAWIDENGHGGQLGSGFLEAVNSASETQLEAMDNAQLNPVIFHPIYGVMITSHRTSQITLSDYSYIPHVRVRDYLVKNIIDQVLTPQLIKLNDADHRTTVKNKADLLLDGPLSLGLLREAQAKCDAQNNNDKVLARREFILDVAVKFTPFSETIKFNFINVSQSTSVNETLGG